ncbi:RagB/SusD family nutrient uptake outer membrane protein [Mucilaginibacter sp. FT3.2]|uniref:RagB/SusD family nutrient uptake outer membrane protein n=1 Tax=Mucilaginibacter sp. FT3.2 TaxID=2723090 RepID=UPI0016160DAD|nr:RagB/SusD family nutrient uptake outer membrane protein [Mucilaginibacter sp. FT3.2]MBB6229771.1 hypothetical protein [Mucilaginibacter sp. FT3.2]
MKKIILAFALIISVSSCKKWLDEKPRSTITTNLYYKTSDDAESAVNGIYNFISAPYNKGGFDDMPYSMLELVTGIWNNEAQSAISMDFYNLVYSPASPYVSTWWSSSYQGIEAANLAISNIPAINMDATEKSNLLGQAQFLRAYFYYNLVNIFGEVPLKLTPTLKPSDGNLPKSSIKDIYEKGIVPDLLAAEKQSMVNTPDGNGRVSLGAVKALLAKVYLSMAGLPLKETDKYGLARDKSAELIANGWFSLFQSDASLTWFNKLNNTAFDNKQENIFGVNYTLNDANASVPVYFLPKEVKFTRTNSLQFGGFYPTSNFINSYDPADLRGKHNMGFFYNTITVDGTVYNFPWAVYKYFDQGLLDHAPNSGKDFALLRYADILLTYAEAQNAADGSPNAAAYTALNGIRTRAGLQPVGALSQDAFQQEVWKERYWELCAEGKNWFDIVRTQQVFNTATKAFTNIVGYTMPSGVTFKTEDLKFPIPESEVQINPLLK